MYMLCLTIKCNCCTYNILPVTQVMCHSVLWVYRGFVCTLLYQWLFYVHTVFNKCIGVPYVQCHTCDWNHHKWLGSVYVLYLLHEFDLRTYYVYVTRVCICIVSFNDSDHHTHYVIRVTWVCIRIRSFTWLGSAYALCLSVARVCIHITTFTWLGSAYILLCDSEQHTYYIFHVKQYWYCLLDETVLIQHANVCLLYETMLIKLALCNLLLNETLRTKLALCNLLILNETLLIKLALCILLVLNEAVPIKCDHTQFCRWNCIDKTWQYQMKL